MISVTGEATVSVPPDLAQIDGGVTSEAKTAREASDANNAAMGKVLLALKGAGIDEKDYPDLAAVAAAANRRAEPRRGPPSIVGYRASNRVTIRLRDVTKVASVIDTLVGAGANDIGGINFRCRRRRNFSTRPANRRSPMPAARPKSMPRPPASRSARRSAFPRAARPGRSFRSMAAPMAASGPVAQGEETLRHGERILGDQAGAVDAVLLHG